MCRTKRSREMTLIGKTRIQSHLDQIGPLLDQPIRTAELTIADERGRRQARNLLEVTNDLETRDVGGVGESLQIELAGQVVLDDLFIERQSTARTRALDLFRLAVPVSVAQEELAKRDQIGRLGCGRILGEGFPMRGRHRPGQFRVIQHCARKQRRAIPPEFLGNAGHKVYRRIERAIGPSSSAPASPSCYSSGLTTRTEPAGASTD